MNWAEAFIVIFGYASNSYLGGKALQNGRLGVAALHFAIAIPLLVGIIAEVLL